MNKTMLYVICGILVLGLAAGAFVMYRHAGPLTFTLLFDDGKGVQPGQFVIYKGVRIGEVKSVDLKEGHAQVIVQIDAAQRKTTYREASFRIAQRDFISGEHEIIMEDIGDVRTPIAQNSVLRGSEGILDKIQKHVKDWVRSKLAPAATQTSK